MRVLSPATLVIAAAVLLCMLPHVHAFDYSRSITINSSAISGSHTNFPLLITGAYSYLATVSNGGRVRNANGYDIAFFSDAALTSPLSFEIESYNPTTGNVTFWVKLPVLNTSTTTLYIAYGDASITSDRSNKTAVWDSNYVGVWHFRNYSAVDANDSSSFANNGFSVNDPTARPGKIGAALNTSRDAGFNRYVEFSNTPSLNFTTNTITMSGWIKRENYDAEINYFAKYDFGVGGYYVSAAVDGSLYFEKTAVVGAYVGTVPLDTNWHYLTVVANSSGMYGFTDGVQVGFDANTAAILPTVEAAGVSGSSHNNDTGLVDEVRVSNTTRTSSWILTEYRNQNSPSSFYTLGSETNIMSGLVCNIEAGNSTCGSGSKFLGLANETGGYSNAHAENYTNTNYANSLCCSTNITSITLSRACGTSFLQLSDYTDAHVEQSNNSNYAIDACISAVNGSALCIYAENNCPAYYTCMGSIMNADGSGDDSTNAHIGACGDYARKLCCKVKANSVCIQETQVCYATVQAAVGNATDNQTVVITDADTYEAMVTVNKHNLTITSNSSLGYPTLYVPSGVLIYVTSNAANLTFSKIILNSSDVSGTPSYAIQYDGCCGGPGEFLNVTLQDMQVWADYEDSDSIIFYQNRYVNMNRVNVTNTGSQTTYGAIWPNPYVFVNNSRIILPSILSDGADGPGYQKIYNTYLSVLSLITPGTEPSVYDNMTAYFNTNGYYPMQLWPYTVVRNSYVYNSHAAGGAFKFMNHTFVFNSTLITDGSGEGTLAPDSTGGVNVTFVDSVINTPDGSGYMFYCFSGTMSFLFVNSTNGSQGLQPSMGDISSCTGNATFQNYMDVYVNDTRGNSIASANVSLYTGGLYTDTLIPYDGVHETTSGAVTEGTFSISTAGEITGTCYGQVNASDNSVCLENEGTAALDPYFSTVFSMPSTTPLNTIVFTTEFRSTSAGDSCRIAVYNFATSRFDQINASSCGTSDVTTAGYLTSGISNYVNSTNHMVLMLYLNSTAINADMNVDFISAVVHSGSSPSLVYSALTNSSGQIAKQNVTWSFMNNTGSVSYSHSVNASKTSYGNASTSTTFSQNRNLTLTLTAYPVCIQDTAVCYTTIQNALTASSTGQTIVIVTNETFTESLTFPARNLNLTSNSTTGPPTITNTYNTTVGTFTPGGNFTISNVMINSSGLGLYNVFSSACCGAYTTTFRNASIWANITGARLFSADETKRVYIESTNITAIGDADSLFHYDINVTVNNSRVIAYDSYLVYGGASLKTFVAQNSLLQADALGDYGELLVLMDNVTAYFNVSSGLYPVRFHNNSIVNNSYLSNNNTTGASFFIDGSNVTISNSTVLAYTSNGGVLRGFSNNTTISDSVIRAFDGGDELDCFGGQANFQAYIINSSNGTQRFLPGMAHFDSCTGFFYYQSYLNSYVNDSLGAPLSGATVTAYDNSSVSQGVATTAGSGFITRLNVSYGYQNSTSSVYLTNHTIAATKTGYQGSSKSTNMTQNQYVNFTLTDFTVTHATPILNSSWGTNRTTENLTCYNQSTHAPSGYPVTNVYNWKVNGSDLMLLNYPFDMNISASTSGAIRDYAGNNQNATLGNGTAGTLPTWNATGKIGGGYTFDGSNDVIHVATTDSFDSATSGTISFWMRWYTQASTSNVVFDAGSASFTHDLALGVNQTSFFVAGVVGGVATFQAYTNITQDNNWHHYAYSSNSSGNWLYIDGVLQSVTYSGGTSATTPFFLQNVSTGTTQYNIGAFVGLGNAVNPILGVIDEFRIYNRTLSTAQVRQAYQEGALNLSNSTMVQEETTTDEIWACEVTPNDATYEGTTRTSANLTVLASTPPTTPVLSHPLNNNSTVFERYPYFNWTASTDAQSDPITYYWNISSPAGCAAIPEQSTGNNYYTSLTRLCVDKWYNWTVRACDAIDGCSSYATSFNFSIASVVGVTFVNNTVNFGGLGLSEASANVTANTTTNTPYPFSYNNTGNVDINTSTRANAALWVMQPLNTSYFQYADANEAGGWKNWSSAYTLLNNSILYQAAPRELEVLVVVPLSEADGVKNTSITVLGESLE